MTQPPNPPSSGSPQQPQQPQQPGGWPPQGDGTGSPQWQSDPTQQLPAGQQYPTQPAWGQQSPGQPNPQQYPPTQPLPAQEQYPETGWGQQQPQQPGQPTQPYGTPGYQPTQPYGTPGYQPTQSYGAPGQYGPPGQSPQPGQYGGAGVPPTPPPAPPGGAGGGGRNPVPLILGVVAGVVALGLLAWFMFLRPAGTATPPPATTTAVESPSPTAAPPSVLITPNDSPTASDTPSPTPTDTGSESPSARPTGTTAAACSDELSSVQCEWAVYLRKYLVIGSCQPDSSDPDRNAFRCTANPRGKLKGDATVTMRWADNSKDLAALMTNFFSRAGVAKSKIGSNWKNPPAHTNWWYNDSPKTIRGKLGSADARDGSGRVAWTFSKQRFYIEAVSERDSAETMLSWWSTK